MAASHDGTSGYVEVNVARLHYETAGAGPPPMMIHAGIANQHCWASTWETFDRAHPPRRCHTRGHGDAVVRPAPDAVRTRRTTKRQRATSATSTTPPSRWVTRPTPRLSARQPGRS